MFVSGQKIEKHKENVSEIFHPNGRERFQLGCDWTQLPGAELRRHHYPDKEKNEKNDPSQQRKMSLSLFFVETNRIFRSISFAQIAPI